MPTLDCRTRQQRWRSTSRQIFFRPEVKLAARLLDTEPASATDIKTMSKFAIIQNEERFGCRPVDYPNLFCLSEREHSFSFPLEYELQFQNSILQCRTHSMQTRRLETRRDAQLAIRRDIQSPRCVLRRFNYDHYDARMVWPALRNRAMHNVHRTLYNKRAESA